MLPSTAVQGAATPVTIEGEFSLEVQVSFVDSSRLSSSFSADLGNAPLTDIHYQDANHLEGVVPPGLEIGVYVLSVTDPVGRRGTLQQAFAVTASTDCIDDNECVDTCHSSATCADGQCVKGEADKDSDGDGFVDALCGGDDCDDDGACGAACAPDHVESWAQQSCRDTFDNDCDGSTDTDDSGCGYAWTAYNDCVYDPGLVDYDTTPLGQSVHYDDLSTITVLGVGTPANDHQTPPGIGYAASSGELINQQTGLGTGVTATLTEGGDVRWQPWVGDPWRGGFDCAEGTDAYQTFHGIADMTGVVAYDFYQQQPTPWWVEITFTGLEPTRTYAFAGSTARSYSTTHGEPGYSERWSIFTLLGAEGAVNASTPGTLEYGNPMSVWFNTGNNHDEGYVVRWVQVAPGVDGTVTVRAEPHPNSEDGKAYGLSVFQLALEL